MFDREKIAERFGGVLAAGALLVLALWPEMFAWAVLTGCLAPLAGAYVRQYTGKGG